MRTYFSSLIFFCVFICSSVLANSELAYKLEYNFKLSTDKTGFFVSIRVDKGELLERVVFKNPRGKYQRLTANGKLVEQDQKIEWQLPKKQAELRYFVAVTNEKGKQQYDALMQKDWAIFRGDDLVPAFHTYEKEGAYSIATMKFDLPLDWKAVETAWKRTGKFEFSIDNPERRFDRPIGWIIMGDVGTRSANVAGTSLVVAAPKGSGMRRMDVLTFFSFVWPEVKKTFGVVPEKLLIVGAPDPMWRGGLSAPNSLYLHVDRPLVSENGTSPLFHEITHMITRIRGLKQEKTNDDWIAEGLAEYYSFELLYKADGISKSRKKKNLLKLADWGKDIKHLRHTKSTGAVTARAVGLFSELNDEIKQKTKNKQDLDDVTRLLMEKRTVSLEDLKSTVQKITGGSSKTLNSSLLK